MVSNTVRVLWLLRESVLTSVQRLANPAVGIMVIMIVNFMIRKL